MVLTQKQLEQQIRNLNKVKQTSSTFTGPNGTTGLGMTTDEITPIESFNNSNGIVDNEYSSQTIKDIISIKENDQIN